MAQKKRRGHRLPVEVIISDMGHSQLKQLGAEGYTVAPHALQSVTSKQWETIVKRAQGQESARDYVRVNGQCYVVGETAEWGANAHRMGSSRYEKDYIGVQTAAMLARTCVNQQAEVVLMASHPPKDARYADKLVDALLGTYHIELGTGDECYYAINQVHTYDEPVGGVMNLAIDGRGNENTRLTSGEILVIDVGGGTVALAPCAQWVQVDYGRIRSYPAGILSVLQRFEAMLYDRYPDMFSTTRKITAPRLREALATGVFHGGGRHVSCKDEAALAKAGLIDEIIRMYRDDNIGGAMAYDTVVLTGGGAALLGKDLIEALDHKRVLAAAVDEEMHLANVFGGEKMMQAMIQAGVVEV